MLCNVAQAQQCDIKVSGQVIDEATNLPLPYVNVIIQETSKGIITDDKGYFSLQNICPGEYHLIFSHIGCEAHKFHLDLFSDTVVNINLSHTETAIGTVTVKGAKDNLGTQPKNTINRNTIEDNTNKNLSSLLENETGVYLLKNGNGISKPVVHGLYGNRLTILNNGIVQSGQQWGNDHSPEIDPYSSDKITIIKGANALEYSGGNLGSIILVEPKPIEKEPHLHGQVNYAFESNGFGHILNARLEKYSPKLAWRVNGTLKIYGDKRAANYWLNNTGSEEGNLSLQLEKSWKEKWYFDFYASTFNTKLGILRGAHIGNLTDLEEALTRGVPFYTEDNFSYEIDAPKQHVSHHLAKLKTRYYFENNQSLQLVLAGQLNNRKEFDVRRSGRSDIPAMNLRQITVNIETKYTKDFDKNWRLKIGNQTIITDNTNNPETGILPLIPDYISTKSGFYTTISKEMKKVDFQLGARYDFDNQDIVAISNGIPREIIRYQNLFHNGSGLFALKYNISHAHSLSFNTGYAMRNPAVNELYSNGLHQGVSGIEEGNQNLKIEKAIKNTLEYKWIPSPHFSVNALAYHQYFEDYIYLNPQDEIRLTIRGAFPVFSYQQTNAHIYGLDLSTQFTVQNSVFGQVRYSFLRGEDATNKTPLISMPPNRLYGSLTYQVPKLIQLSEKIALKELEIEINNKLIFEQKHILPMQDFLVPPPLYNLVGVKIATNAVFPNYKIRAYIKADNIFNVKYRDYLNRQRYFSDDTGFSITLGIGLKF